MAARPTTCRCAPSVRVFAYVRGQLLFSLTMGTSVGVALWIYGTVGIFPDGAHYAVAFRRVLPR